jgi:hypothetical protein
MEPNNTIGILVVMGIIIGMFIKWGGENKKE